MNSKDIDIISAMESFGGSFVKALAGAARRADADNLDRIKVAFPELWARYGEFAADLNDRIHRRIGGNDYAQDR